MYCDCYFMNKTNARLTAPKTSLTLIAMKWNNFLIYVLLLDRQKRHYFIVFQTVDIALIVYFRNQCTGFLLNVIFGYSKTRNPLFLQRSTA